MRDRCVVSREDGQDETSVMKLKRWENQKNKTEIRSADRMNEKNQRVNQEIYWMS